MVTQDLADVTILGAGSYGTALAMCFARNGYLKYVSQYLA